MSIPFYKLLILFVVFVFFVGCASIPPSTIPIRSVKFNNSHTKRACCLLVFLPGKGGSAADFKEEGFIKAVKDSSRAIDMVAVDAHLGYYKDRTLVVRIKEDLIRPAKESGYEKVWIVGVSMGALGALFYAREYPDDIDGVILMGPYLGEKNIIEEIQASGGIRNWQWNKDESRKDEYQGQIWDWLKVSTAPKDGSPKIYLAYGNNDRFSYADDLLSSMLPQDQVLTNNGGHDWSTWRPLWKVFLEDNQFMKLSD